MRQPPSFNPEMESAAQDGTEWLAGSIEAKGLTDLVRVPQSERLKYAPRGELQYNSVMDTNGCASRAPNNILEAELNYLYHNGMPAAQKQWFKDKGYVEYDADAQMDKIVVNDAFIEILSGTTPQGNSLKAPVEAIYKHGAIPRSLLPLGPYMTWEEYTNPARVTQALKDLGQAFRRRIALNFEKVYATSFLIELKDNYIDVGGYAWPPPVNGVYPRTELPFNHAFVLATDAIDALDTYYDEGREGDFTKRLAKNYRFFDWGYKLVITGMNPEPEIELTVLETLRQYGLLAFWAQFLKLFKERVGGFFGLWRRS